MPLSHKGVDWVRFSPQLPPAGRPASWSVHAAGAVWGAAEAGHWLAIGLLLHL